MDMVMLLLDVRLYASADYGLLSRLAASLIACSQLSFLSASQRMWALQKVHRWENSSIANIIGDPGHFKIEFQASN